MLSYNVSKFARFFSDTVYIVKNVKSMAVVTTHASLVTFTLLNHFHKLDTARQ